jgi:hypothetical protein
VADVERISTLTGVFRLPKRATVSAGGNLNFARGADSSLVLSILTPPQVRDAASLARSFTELFGKDATPVPGVGDKALRLGGIARALIVGKGTRTVQLNSGTTAQGDWIFTDPQLGELARVCASRL